MEENQIECGECGSSMSNIDEYENHICVIPGANPQSSEVFTTQEQGSSEENLVPRIIELIQARPPLWDHTLPLKQRGKDVREKLWREIERELGYRLPISDLEKKWKNLKDTFLKNLRMYKAQSGAGTDEKKKWKYFSNMEFLSRINAPKKTISNVTRIESPLSSCSSTSAAVDSEPDIADTPCSSRKMKKKMDDTTEKLLISVLKEPVPPQTSQPQISSALMTIHSILEKLPQRVRMKAEIEMLNNVYSLCEEYGDL